ncbi:hypothetical protein [Xanthobacter autotrophicus]|uniref:hypothetical protein n=1 Tax=Xanthobacter autotrophicus TaxID=280 RepID=UPI0037284776
MPAGNTAEDTPVFQDCNAVRAASAAFPLRPLNAGVLLLLDGNAAFSDIDLDAGRLLPFFIKLVANNNDNDQERTDGEVKNIPVHRIRPSYSVGEQAQYNTKFLSISHAGPRWVLDPWGPRMWIHFNARGAVAEGGRAGVGPMAPFPIAFGLPG